MQKKKTKLLVLKKFHPNHDNGSFLCDFERFEIFRNWGWEVHQHSLIHEKRKEGTLSYLEQYGEKLSENFYRMDGLTTNLHFSADFDHEKLVSYPPLRKKIFGILLKETPDLVWVNYTDYFIVAAVLEWNASKVLVDIADHEYLHPSALEKKEGFSGIASAFKKINNLVVASPFMERLVTTEFPDARVFEIPNPLSRIKFRKEPQNGKLWFFINPVKVKGSEFVLELARKLPNENFLFIRNWVHDELPGKIPDNVSVIPRQASLFTFMKFAKALLVPSVWQEAFGRVPLEAMAAGVPVVGSHRGALPETIGTGGIVLPLVLEDWISVMSQPSDFWMEQRRHGFQRIGSYLEEVKEKYSLLETRLPKTLGLF